MEPFSGAKHIPKEEFKIEAEGMLQKAIEIELGTASQLFRGFTASI
jgi:hypothetical protein